MIIIINGKKYKHISTIAKEENKSASTIRQLIFQGKEKRKSIKLRGGHWIEIESK